jgi:hypothetical protein
MSHHLPLDWYEEHEGQSLVLSSAKVAAKIADLHLRLSEATKHIDEGSRALAKLIEAETALRRIKSLDQKNVAKYAQQIANEALVRIARP